MESKLPGGLSRLLHISRREEEHTPGSHQPNLITRVTRERHSYDFKYVAVVSYA